MYRHTYIHIYIYIDIYIYIHIHIYIYMYIAFMCARSVLEDAEFEDASSASRNLSAGRCVTLGYLF